MPGDASPHRIGPLILLVGLLGSTPGDAADCAAVLEVHGFLRWASNRCGFERYDQGLVEDARRCFNRFGGGVAAPKMYAGRERFERGGAERGREAVCAEITRRFPYAVR